MMKKINLFITLFLFNLTCLLGQQTSIIKTFDHEIRGNISLKDGRLTLKPPNAINNSNNRILLKNAEIINGDLLINFDLAKFRNREKKLTLNVQPSIKITNGEILIAHPKFLEGDFENIYNTKPQQLQLKWNNFQNQYRFGEEAITLAIYGQLQGIPPIDCNNPPVFGKRQKLLHYSIAGLSLGAVLAGQILENSGDDLYRQYRNQVFEGEPDGDATTTYNKANTQNKAGGFLKTVGFVAFGANTAAYIFRQIRFNKKYKDYEYYCEQKQWSVQPYFDFSRDNAFGGMQIAFQF